MKSNSEVLVLNGQPLNKNYLKKLNKEQREALIEPIFKLIREQIKEFPFPNDEDKLQKEWKRLCDCKFDLSSNEIYNNSSVGTVICKYFCKSFYGVCDKNSKTLLDIFPDDELLKKIIFNRLGLLWIDNEDGFEEVFNLSPQMIFFQAPRSMRMSIATSMFKPDVAKFLVEKYSVVGDTVFDYSAGFGGRLLGAVSCGRKYIGTDPLTVPELENMVKYFGFKDVRLIQSGSENWKGEENSVDFCWSSPPYVNLEIYSKDESQAYNKTEDYFYNTYWRKTLENVKYMLKPNKPFGLNILMPKCAKMLEIAKEYFGEPVEEIKLRTIRSHLTKEKLSATKFEPVYLFNNCK